MAETKTTKKTVKKTDKNTDLLAKLEDLRIPEAEFLYKNATIRHGYAEANKMLDEVICVVKGEA